MTPISVCRSSQNTTSRETCCVFNSQALPNWHRHISGGWERGFDVRVSSGIMTTSLSYLIDGPFFTVDFVQTPLSTSSWSRNAAFAPRSGEVFRLSFHTPEIDTEMAQTHVQKEKWFRGVLISQHLYASLEYNFAFYILRSHNH